MASKRALREWLPGGTRPMSWRRHPNLELLESRLDSCMPLRNRLSPEEAVVAWTELADRLRDRLGVELRDSPEPFLWEALEGYAERLASEAALPITSSEWVLLFEEMPETAYVVPCRTMTIGELGLPWPDLYVAPWPRLNWLLLLTHEPGIGPFFVELKRGNGGALAT